MGINDSYAVYYSDYCGNDKNCYYRNTGVSNSTEELEKFFSYDHTFIQFKNNYRKKDNFICANVVTLDCDNDHSDDEKDWIYPEDIESLFPNVPCLIYTSRNHMKQKGSKSPRPRFHAAFPVRDFVNVDEYAEFTKKVQKAFPFFDDNALDGARFFYGNPDTEVNVIEGTTLLNDFIVDEAENDSFTDDDFANLGEIIPEGNRNSTMSKFAAKVLKRFGDTVEAYECFMSKSQQCVPLLDKSELNSIWNSAKKLYKKISSQPDYIPPEEYNKPFEDEWDKPIPFDKQELPPFPVDALPQTIRDYVVAVSETTQTPIDMSATAALGILALCLQKKFRVRGKADWTEPLNLFTVVIAEPSERKSAVINLMTKPVNAFEAEYNKQNAAAIETSRMNKRILERKQRALEDKAAKGKAEEGEIEKLAEKLATYKEKSPLRLYVDDVTTEKLTTVLSEGGGKAAIVSSEGGIFDMLSGLYSKTVNIDVMLKGHSGDCIRVDRVGRTSESIMNPALTVLLTVQPNVLSGLMENGTFRGRGLTSRFLFSMPESTVGTRKYRTEPIPKEITQQYSFLINDLLLEEQLPSSEEITLSPEADNLLESFSNEVESKLNDEYLEIADWAGKLVGAVLRIAGILCRASIIRGSDFLRDVEPLVVDEHIMQNAITIGRYFTEHSFSAFSLMGADFLTKQSLYILKTIKKNGLTEFTRRDIMRQCRAFKTTDEIQVVLNHLSECGYIALKETIDTNTKIRSSSLVYLVNPYVHNDVS
ncbi:MAG: DUF3987 domain-containing protein [Clostridia bacterium]|nr:DUF3987 domain-containing protein [Clostridia bacterium]